MLEMGIKSNWNITAIIIIGCEVLESCPRHQYDKINVKLCIIMSESVEPDSSKLVIIRY